MKALRYRVIGISKLVSGHGSVAVGFGGDEDDTATSPCSKSKKQRKTTPVFVLGGLYNHRRESGLLLTLLLVLWIAVLGRSISENRYELYPFLVDPKAVSTAKLTRFLADNTKSVLATPTRPSFPVIQKLEICKVSMAPPQPQRSKEDFRPMFWLPSFPGSGASNPAKQGDLLRPILEGLMLGEGDENNSMHPVKDFHVSVGSRLRRCRGLSETAACSSNHPVVPTTPEKQTEYFHREAIVAVRNPATAIPAFLAYKNIAYHKGTKQLEPDDWRDMRDKYFEGILNDWMGVLRFWRGTTKDDYYKDPIWVPYEDLVTTDSTKGIAIIKELSDAISGRAAHEHQSDKVVVNTDVFYGTSTSEDDYECLWYRNAKSAWEHNQIVFGDYIPAFTKEQKDVMVARLSNFANEIEKENGGSDNLRDVALVSLLRRYANQIDRYVITEKGIDPPSAES